MTMFEWRDGVLHAEGVPLPAIAEAAGTPTYVYSAGAIRESYRRLAKAFAPLHAKFHYAIKASPNLNLCKLLRSLGYRTEVVHDGAAALEAAPRFRPDVVLLDIGMPGLDGYEVARRLRAMKRGRSLRIVAVTGWGQEADRHRSREAGFDVHLVKPVEPRELLKVLDEKGGRTLH